MGVGLIILCLPCLVTFVSAFQKIDVSKTLDRECYGTSVGFGFSGGPEFHYDALRRRYKDCTYVLGNLEITNLDSENITYDLSFLSSIEVVTGYVLLGLLDTETIPLLNLKLIRADNTYSIMGKKYGLLVALTASPEQSDPAVGLQELQLPSLREISHGRVIFIQNPLLKYVDTIEWDTIVLEKDNPVEFFAYSYFEGGSNCSEACKVDGVSRCWGHADNMCQKVYTKKCHATCPGRCYNDDILGCCHPECANGCWGPSENDCEMCKYFRHGIRCVSTCPERTYAVGRYCEPY
ncbi:hypothetical protein ScPMuIL_017152 [Solemya velum]